MSILHKKVGKVHDTQNPGRGVGAESIKAYLELFLKEKFHASWRLSPKKKKTCPHPLHLYLYIYIERLFSWIYISLSLFTQKMFWVRILNGWHIEIFVLSHNKPFSLDIPLEHLIFWTRELKRKSLCWSVECRITLDWEACVGERLYFWFVWIRISLHVNYQSVCMNTT